MIVQSSNKVVTIVTKSLTDPIQARHLIHQSKPLALIKNLKKLKRKLRPSCNLCKIILMSWLSDTLPRPSKLCRNSNCQSGFTILKKYNFKLMNQLLNGL